MGYGSSLIDINKYAYKPLSSSRKMANIHDDKANSKPHAVCVPFAMQGHINPMLKLAKLLRHKGFHITFVNTECNHKRILDHREPLDGLQDFCFETLPIDHPPSPRPSDTTADADAAAMQYLYSLRQLFREKFLVTFRDLLWKLNAAASTAFSRVPPVTCIVADGFLSQAVIAADEIGVPCALFWNISASGLANYIQYRQLLARCVDVLKGGEGNKSDGSLDTKLEWLPAGAKGLMTVRDLPNLMQGSTEGTDPIDYLRESSVGELERAHKASAHICHTFETLETDKLNKLSSMFPRVFSLGPLNLLLNHIPQEPYKAIGCSLWNEESECLQWLDSKDPNSVVYISFGSFMVSTPDKLVEIAWGLANSKCNFLWIIRPDLVMGESAVLPQDFLLETRERGCIAGWCPQEEVLNHPSVAGIINNSGWNSTIESISAGVPMICWPFFGENAVNCRNSCDEWGIGMELNSEFRRDDVEKVLRELMVEEKGKGMKKKAMEWKHMAEETTGPVGSSSSNLNKLVSEVLLAV